MSSRSRQETARHTPVSIAGPSQVFGVSYEFSDEGVAVYVASLLFAVCEGVEAIKAVLPERLFGQAFRDGDFERLQATERFFLLRFRYKEVNVLGHDDVRVHAEAVLEPRPLERPQRRHALAP